MKQAVRRDALMGIHEYQTDDTAILCAARMKDRETSRAFHEVYAAGLLREMDEEIAAERAQVLHGVNPFSGESFTSVEFRQVIDEMELTPEERTQAFNRLTMMQDFEQDAIEFDEYFAWSEHDHIAAFTATDPIEFEWIHGN